MTEPQSLPDLDAQQQDAWRDQSRPLPERVRLLMEAMTLEEKVAQLYGVWTAISEGEEVSPNQHEFAEPLPPWEELTKPGLGQLTRVFGTGPVEPLTGARVLAQTQRDLIANSRLGTYTNFVNLLGLCGVAVPAGVRSDGLPSSVTLLAPAGADGLAAALARDLHHAVGGTMGATGAPLPPQPR